MIQIITMNFSRSPFLPLNFLTLLRLKNVEVFMAVKIHGASTKGASRILPRNGGQKMCLPTYVQAV
jgi:hypothetical protein